MPGLTTRVRGYAHLLVLTLTCRVSPSRRILLRQENLSQTQSCGSATEMWSSLPALPHFASTLPAFFLATPKSVRTGLASLNLLFLTPQTSSTDNWPSMFPTRRTISSSC